MTVFDQILRRCGLAVVRRGDLYAVVVELQNNPYTMGDDDLVSRLEKACGMAADHKETPR